MTTNAASHRFDAIAANFATSEVHSTSPTIERLHEVLGNRQIESVLDVACGAGHMALSFGGRASTIVGVDAAPRMLATMKQVASGRGVAVAVVEAPSEALPFADGSFDIVVSRLAPHHFPDIRRSVCEMARVVKYGSIVVVIDLEGDPDSEIDEFNHTIEMLHDPNHFRSHTAVESILTKKGFEYTTANSKQLNGMSDSQIMAHRLIIIPGGNYLTMGDNLTLETTQQIRHAVQGGLNYLGICAGGLLAGKAKCNSINLTSGVTFDFYAFVNREIHKAAVPITCVDTPVIEQYWEDGPQFTGWGQVVGKYPDGTPAIVEGGVGKGWVILCGVHPEAPESWRYGMTFTTTARAANEYTGTLVDAALHGTRLKHF